jgi:hypothetical protein
MNTGRLFDFAPGDTGFGGMATEDGNADDS